MTIPAPGDPHRIGHLDGLRGFAALWVLSAHCMIWGGWYGLPLPNAKLAVDVFMVLSGYLMAYNAIERAGREPPASLASWLRFWVRRFFRLAPAYYLVFFAVVVLARPFLYGYTVLAERVPVLRDSLIYHPQYVDFTFANVAAHVTFAFGVLPEYAFSSMLPDWSLSLEMQFYLVFPLLFLAMRRLGPLKVALALSVVCAIATLELNAMPGIRGTIGLFPEPSFLPMKLPVFIAGMLVCEAALGIGVTTIRRCLMQALALALAALQWLFHPYYGWGTLSLVGAVAIMIALASGADRWGPLRRGLAALLGNRVTAFMADTSYSVYLVHGLFISMYGAWLFNQESFGMRSPPQQVLILWLGVVAGSYTLAWLLFRYVERPGIALGRRIVARIDGVRRASAPRAA